MGKHAGLDQTEAIRNLTLLVMRLSARVEALEAAVGSRARPAPTLDMARMTNPVHVLATEASIIFGVSKAEILGRSRAQQYVWPRQWVMAEARKQGMTYPQIARLMDRDHTTIMTGVRAEMQRRENGITVSRAKPDSSTPTQP